jgi:hypothetical protein
MRMLESWRLTRHLSHFAPHTINRLPPPYSIGRVLLSVTVTGAELQPLMMAALNPREAFRREEGKKTSVLGAQTQDPNTFLAPLVR